MTRTLLLASTALLAACATTAPEASAPPAASAAAAAPVADSAKLAAFFESYDKAQLAMSPLAKASRGIRDADYGKWDEFGERAEIESRELDIRTLAALRAQFDRAALSPADQLSYDLFEYSVARSEAIFPYRRHGYVFDQMNGVQSDGPAFLINIHRVDTLADAEAYLSRLQTLDTLLDQAIAEAKAREALGVLPPKWVFPYVIQDARNIVSGAPYGPGADSALFADFKAKVNKLDIAPAEKTRLIESGRKALVEEVKPAYQRVIALMEQQQKSAGSDDGIWRFQNGADQYAALLRYYTTTAMGPEQIHTLGLEQVARIHDEMRGIMKQVGFNGTLQQFFEKMRTDKAFYFPNTDAGRQAYLDKTEQYNKEMTAKLPDWFATTPKAPLVVKRVEAFREKSAGKAFYNRPAPDGSRPGTYYVNLYDMNDMPTTEIEALFYHEGVPGHHLQRAVQTELGDSVPPFRQFGGFTAYSEGWGLYSEKLGKDMGQYQDPYSDFGRLQLELHRAIRLVVDSGIHHKKWTREQAIKYVEDNSADAKGGIVKAIERYVVYPGQATAYMVGKLKIEQLRERARAALGDRFDIKGFHDAVLLSGPVPLDFLERNVDAWIASRKAG
ncbi:DUF885 domain-containing protein [Sphingosinicella sp. LY1275]|uniref:DUF885 domain-containing protein n=1 Tax=Sphingosinicella sp. LY1275 TaxID=3095379 RepID=UPI002ADEEA22|nr:DUF885 domain-containing protein [Sphingosinicella sp. LY1275]MEA1014330.1 DUF885 domain-containing protein [Sphingosinicella sp. LY1275]